MRLLKMLSHSPHRVRPSLSPAKPTGRDGKLEPKTIYSQGSAIGSTYNAWKIELCPRWKPPRYDVDMPDYSVIRYLAMWTARKIAESNYTSKRPADGRFSQPWRPRRRRH